MAICKKCGLEIPEGATVCPACGYELEAKKQSDVADTKAQIANDLSEIGDKLAKLNKTADTTSAYDKSDIEKNKVMAILSYIWLLVLIPIFCAKDSPFAKYHANQGLVLAIVETAYGIVMTILGFILSPIKLGFIVTILSSLGGIVFLALTVIGIINVINGRAKEIPIIGGVKILK